MTLIHILYDCILLDHETNTAVLPSVSIDSFNKNILHKFIGIIMMIKY